MIQGIYVAASNMAAAIGRLSWLGNNAANLSTPGYKQDVGFPEALASQEMLLGRGAAAAGAGPRGSQVSTTPGARTRLDLTQGALRATDGELDLAIAGDGFFVVEKGGERLYTRNGSFVLDGERMLRTVDGGLVLSEVGPITLPQGRIAVQTDGRVLVDGTEVAVLAIAGFAEGAPLRKQGMNYIRPAGPAPEIAAAFEVRQGFLEASNVDPAKIMVDVLMSQKNYGASQRSLQLADGTLQRAVTELGRV